MFVSGVILKVVTFSLLGGQRVRKRKHIFWQMYQVHLPAWKDQLPVACHLVQICTFWLFAAGLELGDLMMQAAELRALLHSSHLNWNLIKVKSSIRLRVVLVLKDKWSGGLKVSELFYRFSDISPQFNAFARH